MAVTQWRTQKPLHYGFPEQKPARGDFSPPPPPTPSPPSPEPTNIVTLNINDDFDQPYSLFMTNKQRGFY